MAAAPIRPAAGRSRSRRIPPTRRRESPCGSRSSPAKIRPGSYDPIFVLAGGPGQSITEVYPAIAPAFDRLHRERDIVLVDQRGTGGSGPLVCPRSDGRTGTSNCSRPRPGARPGSARRSLAADLTRYGTLDYVRDLEAVRTALGYERVNLVGFSYGTRAALAYARAHPQVVRTLVLDGVASFQMVIGNDFDVDSERALSRLFARCADEPACKERYPELERDFRDLLAPARPEAGEGPDPPSRDRRSPSTSPSTATRSVR